MGDVVFTTTAGQQARAYRRGTVSGDPVDQYVIPVEDKIVSFQGRCTTPYMPGRAAMSQKVFAIHNATASPVLVSVDRIRLDMLNLAVKAVTIVPPMIRIHRFTALPTNGTNITSTHKAPLDTTMTSDAAVTVWCDASADNTSSATTLTVTIPSNSLLAEQWAGRVFTAVGYEEMDRPEFFGGEPDITLRALEGLCVFLDAAVVTTGNPTTDKWAVSCDWTEYTRPEG